MFSGNIQNPSTNLQRNFNHQASNHDYLLRLFQPDYDPCTACARHFAVFGRMKLCKPICSSYLRAENIFSGKCDLCNGHSYKRRRVWYNRAVLPGNPPSLKLWRDKPALIFENR